MIPDLVRQWIDILRLKEKMHTDLPREFTNNWNTLPWKRYQIFYGVLVPVIIHDALLRLHKTPMTTRLRKVVSAQALVTGIFDDLFDRLHLPTTLIRNLMEAPEYIRSSDYIEEYLCQYLYREMHEHFTGSKKLLEDSVQNILYAQERSNQQQSPQLSLDKILEITRNKGAKAVIFYRSCIDQAVVEDENEFLTDLGELFQMTNDINDALKDHADNELTFMTAGLSLKKIKEIFDRQITCTFDSYGSLPDDLYHKGNFFNRINLIVARSLVTLDRYGRLADAEAPFDIGAIPKNKMISGVMIPYEVGDWLRCYRKLSDRVVSSSP